jgi:predicted AAA+ superfamily ATPase
MQQIINRQFLMDAIQVRLEESPVVALLGARQVGKTTLAEQVSAGWQGPWTLFDLEKSEALEALRRTPQQTLSGLEGLVIIDEVQRMPELFTLLRPLCDDRQRRCVYLLLGSASWDLVKGVSETLAGRIQFVDVSGVSLAEVGAEMQDACGCAVVFRNLFCRPVRQPGSGGWKVSPAPSLSGIFPAWGPRWLPPRWDDSGACLPTFTDKLGTLRSWPGRWM